MSDKAYEAIVAATGSDFCYEYEELINVADEAHIRHYCGAMRRLFAPVAKAFTAEDNSRWALRYYLAIKYAMAASLMGGSARYAKAHNLRLAVPYFNYYTVLNACRAFLLTSPLTRWDGRRTVEMTHETIVNRTADELRALDPSRRESWQRRSRAS